MLVLLSRSCLLAVVLVGAVLSIRLHCLCWVGVVSGAG